MGATFYNLTDEELCELMCGGPEDDEEEDFDSDDDTINAGWEREGTSESKRYAGD